MIALLCYASLARLFDGNPVSPERPRPAEKLRLLGESNQAATNCEPAREDAL